MTDSEEGDEDYVEIGEGDDDDKPRVRIVRNQEAIERKNKRIDETRDTVGRVADRVAESAKERVDEATEDAKDTIDEKIKESVDSVDTGLVELLSSFLETETRSKVYLYLRKRGEATSEEIAEDTGLYPSTVRETLSDLYQEGIVERRKKQTEGAGNNPYVYTAIPPSNLAQKFSERVEERLNKLFNLDSYLDTRRKREISADWSPYKIVIDSEDEDGESESERVR
ncbi:MAG: helix-turn-helix domain-containing protein [Halobacteria archaeon]|nr:helix-turn-helix domain-containing protein [Halobacteria archaeon]